MSYPTKSLDPIDRLGVYKRHEEVPDRFRFQQYTEAYENRDVWQEFCDEYEYQQGSHAHYEEEVNRAGDRWCSFMQRRERHHALATPSDVEAWCTEVRDGSSVRRTYDYWLRINRFYDWLQWHTEHPHVYNPVLMATVVGETTKGVWEWKATRTREKREDYRGEGDE